MKAALLAVATLAATLVAASPAAAANQLSFGDAPAGWSVTSGEADADLGTVRATGVKKNRIRYSLQGSAGFAVRPRQGVVSYDGTELPAGEALLTITTRDRKGKVADASVTITVSVTAAEPVTQLQVQQPQQQIQADTRFSDGGLIYKVVHSKLVRFYDSELGRYRHRLDPVGYRPQPRTVYEENSVSGFHRAVTYMESNWYRTTWTIDDEAKKYGFRLGRLDGSTYHGDRFGANRGSDTTNDAYERVIAVHYDGSSWDNLDPELLKGVTVTGTIMNDPDIVGSEKNKSIEVTFEVCLLARS